MNENIKRAIENKIETITTKEEYDRTMNLYMASDSEAKFEAILMLKKAFPLFEKGEKEIYSSAMHEIYQSQADLSDIGN